MRISTGTIYESGVSVMQKQSQSLLHTQQQIALGRRVLTPADDPVAAARALEISQAQAINAQYAINGGNAKDALTLEESVLGQVWSALQSVRDLVLSAGNASYSSADLASLATELGGRYQELLGLANSTDGSGRYLFSGYQGGIQPFSENAPGSVDYQGDQGQRLIQVDASRQIAVSEAGADVFQRIASGNGSFLAQAAASNSGGGVIDAGQVLNAGAWNDAANSKDLSIVFSVVGGNTEYRIIDNAAGGAVIAGPRAYTSGAAIKIAADGPPARDFGAQITITGSPADADRFDIGASTVDQDVFSTLHDIMTVLQSGAKRASLNNGLVVGLQHLDNAMAKVSSVRTSTGARLKELDSVLSAGEERALQYSATLSRLQDVDYAQAASDLTQQQVNLQAAQKSFVQVAGLSLFDYL